MRENEEIKARAKRNRSQRRRLSEMRNPVATEWEAATGTGCSGVGPGWVGLGWVGLGSDGVGYSGVGLRCGGVLGWGWVWVGWGWRAGLGWGALVWDRLGRVALGSIDFIPVRFGWSGVESVGLDRVGIVLG